MLATRGAVLCDLEQFAAAADALTAAISRNPGDDMALANLGFACAERMLKSLTVIPPI